MLTLVKRRAIGVCLVLYHQRIAGTYLSDSQGIAGAIYK